MADEIRPALTPEEWEREAFDGGHGFDHPGARFEREGYSLEIMPHGYEDDSARHITVDGNRLHALAALALHDQPFGFTREDVEAIHHLIDTPDWNTEPAQVQRALSLAARIAALLPPEGT